MLARRVERVQFQRRRINGPGLGDMGDLGIGSRETQILTGLIGAVGATAGSFFGARAGAGGAVSAIPPALTALIEQGARPATGPLSVQPTTAPATIPKKPPMSTNTKIAIGAGVGLLAIGAFFAFR